MAIIRVMLRVILSLFLLLACDGAKPRPALDEILLDPIHISIEETIV